MYGSMLFQGSVCALIELPFEAPNQELDCTERRFEDLDDPKCHEILRNQTEQQSEADS